MSKPTTYRDLIAWQKSMQLGELIYRITEDFPKREWYGLAQELRRSAVSIPSNLAEGQSQGHRAYIRHVVIAIGSSSELSSQAELAGRLKYIQNNSRKELTELIAEVGRLCQGLLNALRKRANSSQKPDP